MKVLFYLAETQSVDETRVKAEMLFWWAKVREVQAVGAVFEFNEKNSLGDTGKSAISVILKQYDVDALVVAYSNDISGDPEAVCSYMKRLKERNVELISLAGDLPRCETCMAEEDREKQQRAYHCTVTIFHE